MFANRAAIDEKLSIKTVPETGQRIRASYLVGTVQNCIERCDYPKNALLKRFGLPLLDKMGAFNKDKDRKAKMYVILGDICLLRGVMARNNPLSDRNKGEKLYRKAAGYYSKAIELGVDDADVFIDCGLAYVRLNKQESSHTKAIDMYTRSIALVESADAYNNRGYAHTHSAEYCGKKAEDLKKKKDALATELRLGKYSLKRNVAADTEKEYNLALEGFRLALEQTRKEFDLAREDFRKAKQLRPDYFEPAHNIPLVEEKISRTFDHIKYVR